MNFNIDDAFYTTIDDAEEKEIKRKVSNTDLRSTESFNGRLRDECLNQHIFKNIAEAREIIIAWKDEYNQLRPHSSLGNLTPLEYAESLRKIL